MEKTNSSYQSFLETFNGSDVSIVKDSLGNFWIRATEACNFLGFKGNADRVIKMYCKDHQYQLLQNGLGRPSWYVSESGFYRLVLKSKSIYAENFIDWLTEDVLPKLRAEGGYIMPTATLQQLEGLEKQIVGLKNEVYLLSQDSCYRQLVKAFIRDNLVYESSSYVRQSQYTDRFWEWVETDAALVWKPQSIDDMNNRELVQEMAIVMAEVRKPPKSKMFMAKGNKFGDVENAKLIKMGKADSNKVNVMGGREIYVKELMSQYGE